MKIDRHVVSRCFIHVFSCLCFTIGPGVVAQDIQATAELNNELRNSKTQTESAFNNDQAARQLMSQVMHRIAMGEAFDAKIRQRVWVGGREVVGVGSYEQSGKGLGQFNLQVAMHDGDGKHTLQQISDGRLAWTREQIGEDIQLSRIDVGRLDQWSDSRIAGPSARAGSPLASSITDLPPSVRVGAWTEMLETLMADHQLRLVNGQLEGRNVWIVRGALRNDVRAQRLQNSSDNKWPELSPTQFVIAIAKANNPETQFGQGLPLRIEFWTDPMHITKETNRKPKQEPTPSIADVNEAPTQTNSRLISLIELYSIRQIAPPPIQRFRFDNQDMEVNFSNQTDRYLTKYGIHITERQSRLLRR